MKIFDRLTERLTTRETEKTAEAARPADSASIKELLEHVQAKASEVPHPLFMGRVHHGGEDVTLYATPAGPWIRTDSNMNGYQLGHGQEAAKKISLDKALTLLSDLDVENAAKTLKRGMAIERGLPYAFNSVEFHKSYTDWTDLKPNKG